MIIAPRPLHLEPHRSLGTQVNDLLGQYGLAGGTTGALLDALAGNPLGALTNMRDAFTEAALGYGTTQAERERFTGTVAPFGHCLPPHAALGRLRRSVGNTYHQRVDLAPGAKDNLFARIFDPRRRAAAKLERLLTKNPFVRHAFERAVGAKLVPDGNTDGKITLRRTLPRLPHLPPMAGFHPSANTALGFLQGMERAILSHAAGLANKGAAGFAAAGLGQAAGQGDDVSAILKDPSLTVEDKISLMLMSIMKKMDKEIQEQGENINKLQQQQNQKSGQGGKGGKGGLLGTVGGIAGAAFGGPLGAMAGSSIGNAAGGALQGGSEGSSKSIDVETMKLKRLIDKRSQMFDMLRQIIDKYNQTAKGIIDSIGR